MSRLTAQPSFYWTIFFSFIHGRKTYWVHEECHALQVPCWKDDDGFLPHGVSSLGGTQLSIQIRRRARIKGRQLRWLIQLRVKSWFYLNADILFIDNFWPWFWLFFFKCCIICLDFLCFWHLHTFFLEANTSLTSH